MNAAMPVRAARRPKTGTKPEGGKTDPRVDAYLTKAGGFAQPILKHLRALIHANCPQVEETIKWNRPMFIYRGRILCGVAAFKAHCALSFWQSEVAALIVQDGHGKAGDGAGQFGRITSLADLPDDETLRRYLAQAVRVLENGKARPPQLAAGVRRTEIPLPDDFAALLEKHPAAAAAFAGCSPSHRREYLEWIVEAKREETRAKRMATALEWLAQGKKRNWKYENCSRAQESGTR